jgi:DNA-binding NarL/FixJ family response regulator
VKDNVLLPRARLEALWSTCSDLARDRRALLERISDQMEELRAQRQLLNEQRIAIRSTGLVRGNGRGHNLEERYGLTARELEVAMLLALGRSNAAIASELGISPHTARHHTQRVLAKVSVHSRAEAGARLRVDTR